jgi:NDP-sugar pyrophosphorylase family protein
LVALREKPAERVLINAGVYVLSPRVVAMVLKGRVYPITELVQACLQKRQRVGAFYIEDDWLDIGRPDELRRARGEL